jgi:membrane-bound metal-dependent hydrolase YbcI (DUF457 family)
MVWGYVVGRTSSSILKVSVNPYLLLFLAALPDIDLLLGIVGIQHRTWTHSVLVWSVIFAPLFVMYRKRSIPYFLAPIQHIIFGDAIVGAWNRPLYPISHFNFSLGYGLLSIENIALEAAGLGIFILLVLATKNARRAFFFTSRKALAIPSLVFLVGFVMFLFSYSWISEVLLQDFSIFREDRLLDSIPSAVRHPLFPYAIAMHLILMGVISASLVLGFKARGETTTTVAGPSTDSKYR